MSAWMTTRTHRSAIVQAAVVEQTIEMVEAGWLFDELTRINRLALHHRYGEPHPDLLDYEHREVAEAPLDNDVLIKNIGCLRYQCAEYDDWDREPAMLVIEDLRLHLLATEGYEQNDEGFDRWYRERDREGIPWGIDKWSQVVAVEQVNLP
jgi:hypothetical protein